MTEEEILVALRLMGKAQFIAGNEEAAASVRQLGVATEATGLAMTRTRQRSYLMNQALFTMRRLIYGVTLGFIAGGVAVAKWGFDFNETMKSASISLRPMLGSAQAVNEELDVLFQQAKYSPFTFQDTTLAFRNMYLGMRTLGISAETVNGTMQAIIDTLSAGGRTTPAALNRVAWALQHVAYQGRLTGRAVNQLGQDGIPVAAILRKEFGLTAEQIHNVGKLGIPTIAFMQAFTHYAQTNPIISGAARRQAMGSFQGLFAQFKDSMSQIMGAVERGFFNRSIGMLQRITTFFSNAGDAIKNAGSAADVIRALFPQLLPLWVALAQDVHLFWQGLSAVIAAIVHSPAVWTTLYLGLEALRGVLVLINPLLQTMSAWINFIIPLWIAWKSIIIATTISTATFGFVEAATTTATKDLTFAQFLLAVAMGRYQILTRVATALTWLYIAAQSVMSAGLDVLAASWLTVAAAEETEAVAATAAWTATLLPIALVVGAIMGIVAAIILVIKYWTQFKQIMRGNVGDALGIPRGHWYSQGGIGHALHLPDWLTGYKPPAHAASGGTVLSSGLSWVGENGPELMHLPAGASITPNNQLRPVHNMMESWMQGQGKGREIHVHVHINRREIARAVADEYGLAAARA